jgi:hypothetical protein
VGVTPSGRFSFPPSPATGRAFSCKGALSKMDDRTID